LTTKKGDKEFWALKWKFVPKKVIRKFGPRNFLPVPPNWAPSSRPCIRLSTIKAVLKKLFLTIFATTNTQSSHVKINTCHSHRLYCSNNNPLQYNSFAVFWDLKNHEEWVVAANLVSQ